MIQRVKDFVTLFNGFWYRDFPLSENHKLNGSRAEWTTHIGNCVKACADLMGFFTYFESGIRTDAIIKNNRGREIAHLEWEWKQPLNSKVNEIKKLYSQRESAEFSVFLSYSRLDHHAENLNCIQEQWGNSAHPLLVFLVTFNQERDGRRFYHLESYHFQHGRRKKIRSQPALPWEAKGTRWESKVLPTTP
jgi:hypothetical protein